MKIVYIVNKQIRAVKYQLSMIFLISAILLLSVVGLHMIANIEISQLTRDPVSIAELPPYAGFLSQIGIFFWAAAATLCLFCGLILPADTFSQLRRFYQISGLLTLILAFDDIFQLHEVVFPYIGISEKIVYAFYVSCLIAYLYGYFPLLKKSEYLLLLISFAFFGLSIIIDFLFDRGNLAFFVEDSAKLLGILFWGAFYYRTISILLRRKAFLSIPIQSFKKHIEVVESEGDFSSSST